MIKKIINALSKKKLNNDSASINEDLNRNYNGAESNEIINKLFSSKNFYYLEVKDEKGNIVKYTQLIDDNNDNLVLLGLVFTSKEKADEYINSELKALKKNNIKPISMDINQILAYINNLKKSDIEGIIIDYPYDWCILKF